VKERAESRPRPERMRRESSVDGASRGVPGNSGAAKCSQLNKGLHEPSPPPGETWPVRPAQDGYGSQAEAGAPSSAAIGAGESTATGMSFDMETYRDFERVFPGTSSNATAKQAALYNQILERVSEVFRPVNAPRKAQREKDPAEENAAASLPPQPKLRKTPAPAPSDHRARAAGASLSPSRASYRSRSAPGPGPPRCAYVGLRVVDRRLEAAQRSRSTSAQRADRMSLASSDKQPCRVALPLRTVAVTL